MNTIQRSTLQQLIALTFVTPKNDVRYYMNGVWLNGDTDQLRLVATNGHMATQIRTEEIALLSEVKTFKAEHVILERESIMQLKNLLKNHKYVSEFKYELTNTGLAVHKTESMNGEEVIMQTVIMPRIHGKFPDIDRVFPSKNKTEIVRSFNPDYLTDIQKVHKAIGVKSGTAIKLNFQDDPNTPFIIETSDECIQSVMMPCRI